jgi:hypothetical protein
MGKEALRNFLAQLPPPIQSQIEGYVSSVETRAFEIFQNASITFTNEKLDALLFYSGLRRLWSLVQTQYWILDNCLHLVGDQADGVQVAGVEQTFQSRGYRSFQGLWFDLENIIQKAGVRQIVEARNLVEVLILEGQ